MVNIETGIQWITDKFKNDQSPDGSWKYPFETGISTDAYMIILLRTLEINDEHLIRGLAERIISKQEKNGSWKLFYDEGIGNVSTTIEAYYALLYSGFYQKDDKRLREAKAFLLDSGGIEAASMFTKIMLALTGQYKWPEASPVPIEIILLPLSFPVNFYQFSVYGRANLAPMMIVADKKYSQTTSMSPNLSDLSLVRYSGDWKLSDQWRSLLSVLKEGIGNLTGLPEQLHFLAIERTKKYTLDHIETDGTLFSYFSSTFLMIFAFLSLGFSKKNPVIMNAIKGLMAMRTNIDGLPHMQYTTAHIWNTSLISFSLQLAGVSHDNQMIEKANHYMLSRQHEKFGDWVIHNPHSMPGGWGFSNINTFHPDVDDTTAVLRSIAGYTFGNPPNLHVWERGVSWLFSMQNDDGGWASFEKNVQNDWIEWLPIEKAEFLLSDPSTADLTGRTLEFLGNYTNLAKDHKIFSRAVNWLLQHQEENGSWYGRWGICYLYGTWAAVTGLIAAGLPSNHPSIVKATRWLKSIQNADGGWGESCLSDSAKRYISLNVSTLIHTSWALDSLIMISDTPSYEIQKGIYYLMKSIPNEDWTLEYPKGQGMAGGFYIHYHSYRYVFPLITLSHFKQKFYFVHE